MPRADDDVDRAGSGKNAERVEAAVDDRPEVAVIEMIRGDDVDAGLLEFVRSVRNVHPVNAAAVIQPADVIVEPEDRRPLVARVVAADTFEEA